MSAPSLVMCATESVLSHWLVTASNRTYCFLSHCGLLIRSSMIRIRHASHCVADSLLARTYTIFHNAIICFAMLILSGCSSVSGYVPYIVEISDPAALAHDESVCLTYALDYSAGFDLAEIANAGAQGAANNAAGAAINPLVPVAGGLGGAGAALLGQVGLLGTAQRKVFLICLHDRGFKSGLYAVMDPN